jgi:hypothetical protein
MQYELMMKMEALSNKRGEYSKEEEEENTKIKQMHPSGIEPEPIAWKAIMIPFHHGS